MMKRFQSKNGYVTISKFEGVDYEVEWFIRGAFDSFHSDTRVLKEREKALRLFDEIKEELM